MVTRKTCAATGYDRRRRINRVPSEHTALATHLLRLAVATLIAGLILAPAWGDTEGCTVTDSVATCEDVSTGGIQSDFDDTGITEIRVGDGVDGETVVTAGEPGIRPHAKVPPAPMPIPSRNSRPSPGTRTTTAIRQTSALSRVMAIAHTSSTAATSFLTTKTHRRT